MDVINEDSLKGLVNRMIQVETEKRFYVGRLVDVGNKQIKLRMVSKQKTNPIISILIEDIDAIMYKIPSKNVGY